MNYSTAVMLINPSIRAVRGQYDPNHKSMEYNIFKTLDQNIKVDDYVVVESGTRHHLTTVKIVEVDVTINFDGQSEMKWVIQKIDIEPFDKIKKMEADAVDLIKRGEMRKRREDIRKNTLDAIAAGEIDNLAITKLTSGTPVIEGETTG